MAFWQRAHEGELWIDHRFSPGLPAEAARCIGLDPSDVKEGKLFEAATMGCSHCNSVVIKNPNRTRERATCLQCSNHYICDWCDAERRRPEYVHRPFREVVDLVRSGKFTLAPGSTAVRPILVPTVT